MNIIDKATEYMAWQTKRDGKYIFEEEQISDGLLQYITQLKSKQVTK